MPASKQDFGEKYMQTIPTSNMPSNTTNTFEKYINTTIENVNCTINDNMQGSICKFLKQGGNEYIYFLHIFQFVCCLWIYNFIAGLSQMSIAGTYASHYWSPGKTNIFPLLNSIRMSLRYHIGTIAFGSMIITVIQVIRIFLEYIDYNLKNYTGIVGQFLIKCLKCCTYCLEKFIKFVNRNAYIMCAITGKNFFSSAKDAFSLIINNAALFCIQQGIASFMLFLIQFSITVGMGIFTFFWFDNRLQLESTKNIIPTYNVNIIWLPIIIIGISSLVISSIFFSVFRIGIDTLHFCIIIDLEKNNGSAQKPYKIPKNIHGTFISRNKKVKEIEKLSAETK
ncbi:hypothetical protein A3Q56_00010 [Intoshia linei]|uniref:Choline transporter-like protein n=1 Tax=Intoshia linei TaxID=1819745 RepID=A0A177BDA3_9BILA|nr:hypothetical protein A3Q56_00010 [Intoshia linei]